MPHLTDTRFQIDADEQARLIQSTLRTFRAELVQAPLPRAVPTHVSRALTCIHEHLFDERLNAAFVCAACGFHNHNVSILFKHVVGLGMGRYIEEQRLAASRCLLRHEALSVTEIAWAVGYTYLESFERAFRRRGCSPTQFREQTKG